MRHIILDISGKVPYYEHALCEALQKNDLKFMLATPYEQSIYNPSYNILQLPRFYSHTKQGARKVVKAAEGVFNYIFMVCYLLFHKVDTLHLQWLPFLEYASFEFIFLRLFKAISHSKLLLTVHNVFPHDMSESDKVQYVNRFRKCDKYIDKYIVHTESSKIQLSDKFNIAIEKIEVVYHGVFVPQIIPSRQDDKNNKFKVLMFGVQSLYKGTDLLIDSISSLSTDSKSKIEVIIAGKTDSSLYNNYKPLADELGIKWINRFIDDGELNQLIMDANLVVFPYRSISQSGALLLTLFFKKPMLLSDLPSFMETVEGLPDYCFFNTGEVGHLSMRLQNFIEGGYSEIEIANAIDGLLQKYSWTTSAKKTLKIYNCIINN